MRTKGREQGRFVALSCFHKAEVFLILCQEQASELNEPVELLQKIVHLVAHPVGFSSSRPAGDV